MTIHEDQSQAQPVPDTGPTRLRDAPRYLWLVFASTFLGWAFDAMDLNLLTLMLTETIADLADTQDRGTIASIGGTIIALKLLAWGVGGIVFGMLTDRFGRARILGITVIIYALFTGLSAVSTSVWQLAVFQMLAGLGIGGEWAAGAALLAETWPDRLRPKIMQLMQMGFAAGFFLAALLALTVGPFGWRWVFAAGLVPILLTVVMRKFIREPDRWHTSRQSMPAGQSTLHTTRRLLDRDLRKPTLIAVLLGIAMMVGSWGGLTWLPSWITELAGGPAHVGDSPSHAFMLLNAGAIAGYLALMFLSSVLGRRTMFALFCAGALVVSLVLFTQVDSLSGVMWMMPLYGFFVVGGFGIFAVYLPELFPTVVRATGQGLAWNFARVITAFGVLGSSAMVTALGSFPAAAAAVACVYVVGLVAVWFGPETAGRSLRDV
ncbi:MFS transporter [Streptomyces sp. NPDC004609]|uniref:MFS transporter n=1 Tax=Streptomyces sp. NPDC004609 TaxID=3364704 RepID=UPI00367D773E